MLCVHVHQESFLIDTIQQKSFLQNLHNSSINRASFNDPYWSFTQYETFFHSINSLARSLFVWFRIQMQIYNKQQLQIELFLFFLLHLNDFFCSVQKQKLLFVLNILCVQNASEWMNEWSKRKASKDLPFFQINFSSSFNGFTTQFFHPLLRHYSVCTFSSFNKKKREK